MLTDNEIKKATEDSLKFNALSETLKEIITESNTPLTIGLYGEWGSGKTSLMRMTKESLENSGKVIKTVWFDAWKFDKSHDLRVALIQSILRVIEEDDEIKPTFKEKVGKLRKRINWGGLGLAAINQVLPRPIISQETTDHLYKNPEDITNTLELIGDFEEKFMEITQEYVGNRNGILAIFIDDLDRCIPGNTIDILESIKLFLNVPDSVFIIGADKKVIESGIHHKYPKIYEDWGRKYLDKIIQIPFFLPPLREDIILNEFIPRLPIQNEIKQYKEIIAAVGENPRTIKRLINQFELQTILAKKQKIKVDSKIMAKLSVIQFRQPEFHDTLVEMYVETKTNLVEILKQVHESNDAEKEKLEEWKSLEKYFDDKKFIKFLFEEPSLEKISLDDYVYLVRSTTSFNDEKIDNLSMGISFAEKEEYNKAIENFNKAIKLNPNNVYAWYNKGDALSKLEKYSEAIKYYNRAIELDPDYKYAWYNRGNIFSKLGKYNEAIESYNRAIELDPDYKYAWYNKGNIFSKLGKYNKAVKCYEKTIELDPDIIVDWYNVGDVFSKLGKYNEAIESYNKVIQLDPKDINSWYSMGNAYMNLSQFNQAIGCYDKVLEFNPNLSGVWTKKGDALEKLGRHDEAREAYARPS